ncbi:hypothetical protein LCGC14_0502580 [marine sediment metagenome]|uniref:Lipoprotein n=2 Tax=root TaxID=1 RepID=A0A831QQ47_9FLAO|nr:hypothetical protein [Pricia antarctica]
MKKIKWFGVVTFALFAFSCDKEDTVSAIRVEFSGAENTSIANTELMVSIYGFDPNYQDVLASLITKQVFNTDQIPFVVRIDIPSNPSQKIEYINDTNDASYYLALEWDSDGNGKRCNGDILEDFERNSGIARLNLTTRKIQSFYLDVITKLPCD